MSANCVKLIIPFLGEWDLSTLLTPLEVKSVKVTDVLLKQNAKPGAKILNDYGEVKNYKDAFKRLTKPSSTLILREPTQPVSLKFFNGLFDLDKYNAIIPEDKEISYDLSMNVKLSCSFDPNSYKFELNKTDKVVGVVVEFSTTDERIEVV